MVETVETANQSDGEKVLIVLNVLLVAMEAKVEETAVTSGAKYLGNLVDTMERVVMLAVGHLVLVVAMAVMEVPIPALFLEVYRATLVETAEMVVTANQSDGEKV